MANQSKTMQPFFLFFLLSLFLLNSPSLLAQDQEKDELDILLSFKSSIHDPFKHLSNWNNNSPSNFCNWQGITCANNSSHVTAINLPSNNFSGPLPSSIFHLPYLQSINLSTNQFSAEIPQTIFSSSSLQHLNLSNNNLTGSLPINQQVSPIMMETLDLSSNMLTGEIPENIGSTLSKLRYLDLGGNLLVGKIPMSITNISGLESLTLATNQLVGEIPKQLGKLKNLKWIYLGYNNFSGEIPQEIGGLPFLNHLDLVYNNLTGGIPSSLGNLTNLEYLFLYRNKLTGPIPASVFRLRNLVSLDLSDNSLSGEIPKDMFQMQRLEILHLFSNNFTGEIPVAISSLPSLQVLQLWSNKFTGEIPDGLGKRSNLTVLDLSTNFLTGGIPETVCSSGSLFKLILFSNSLKGEIPESLSSCRSLKRVRLQNNKLSGDLSPEFTRLPFVYFLDISGNKLSGRIDHRRWEMSSLQMLNLGNNRFSGGLPDSFGSDRLENLDLSENNFSGAIPATTFESLSELMQLKLSKNQLSGEIPGKPLSSCKKLVSLDLGHNQLSGPIPVDLDELPVLGQLDLSNNDLSGEIPKSLGRMESLVQINISHNHFRGNLPLAGAFAAINATAVAGNDLCTGAEETISAGLPPCHITNTKSSVIWHNYLVACIIGSVAFLALAAYAVVLIITRRRTIIKVENQEDGNTWELRLFESSKISRSITVENILGSKKDENVISRGDRKTGDSVFAISYVGKSRFDSPDEQQRTRFVVKEIASEYVSSIPASFWAGVAELGRIKHPNVVKLMGVLRSNKEEACLVYEYIEGRNLNEVLGSFSWERRKRLAIGIARALWFLHSRCSPGIIVGCMSPEKIIVDGKHEPHLELSPNDLLNFGFSSSKHLAPEAKERKELTEKGDIYGFGLILIQLITGKGALHQELGVEESIVEWARYCYSDCHMETWVDPMVMMKHQNEVVEAMNLALRCTATDPVARPCAKEVSKTLESAFIPGSSCAGSTIKF
ncbi:Leucine-rich repeat receptor-like serine/threonine-protein kinase SKM1 [Linum grandiflorum]